jgi:integrase
MRFTDTGLRSLSAPEKGQRAVWDEALPTFGVRVSQGGSKTFVLKHQNRFHTIGRFPLLSLSAARTEAKRMLAEFTLGRIRPHSITTKQAIELFINEKKKSRRPRTVQDYKWLLNRHFAFTGQLADITPAQVSHRLAKLPRSQYNHALTAGRIFFNWCRKQRYITDNPCEGFAKHSTQPRTRILSDGEIKSIWRACGPETLPSRGLKTVEPDLPASFATIVKLLILTGMRRSECAAIRKEYIKDNLLTLPPTLTKNGREHSIPLTGIALNLLPNSTNGYLLSAKNDRPFAGWSKAKSLLDNVSGVSGWTLHDIRRTVATRLAEMGVAPHVIERLLNHTTGQISGVAAIYNRARYLDEMRQALELWENHLTRAFL